MQARILRIAEEHGMIQWPYGALDGSFSLGQGGGEGVSRGGKGLLIHGLTDAAGMSMADCTTPTHGHERARVLPLLDAVRLWIGKPGVLGNARRCWRQTSATLPCGAHVGLGSEQVPSLSTAHHENLYKLA